MNFAKKIIQMEHFKKFTLEKNQTQEHTDTCIKLTSGLLTSTDVRYLVLAYMANWISSVTIKKNPLRIAVLWIRIRIILISSLRIRIIMK